MFSRASCSVTRTILSRPSGKTFSRLWDFQRAISITSIHSTFPATLLRFQTLESSSLFDFSAGCGQGCVLEDGVTVSKDGLVYPTVSTDLPFSNGATFLPNTFNMQEIVRAHYDEYIEKLGSDSTVKSPLIFSIPKGVPIPTTLILFREYASRFSLQPSYRMPLAELNSLLDTFYSEHADKCLLEQWLDEHDFGDAIADDAEAQWMAKS